MIRQISPIAPKTHPVSIDLAKARLIQAKVKSRAIDPTKPTVGELWSPITSGPIVVPIIRWIE